uniref:Uncharacterized protein n=1 Tax=Anguilla anguilla TaxID=7936 RepID=A0A0E9XYX7_ANGAN
MMSLPLICIWKVCDHMADSEAWLCSIQFL